MNFGFKLLKILCIKMIYDVNWKKIMGLVVVEEVVV